MIKHRYQLPQLMQEFNLPMVAVEVGCAEGLFSADLINGGIELLYLVDNWGNIHGQVGDGGFPTDWHNDNYKQMSDRLSPLGSRYKVLKGLSVDMAKEVSDNILGLVYIDCDHSYEGVMSDINTWFHKLVTGGIMAFHDYENDSPTYGVKRAVTEFCNTNGYTIVLLPEMNIVDAGAYFIKH